MKVAVIGAGIIGVTTAYELSADGHQVTVFERRGSVAAEASFANAGIVAATGVAPWSAGMPATALGQMLRQHAPLQYRGLPLGALPWAWRWWRACRSRTWQANQVRVQRLAHFSRERLHKLTDELKLDYERGDGHLVLLRSAKDLAGVRPGLDSLIESRTRFELLSAGRCRVVEPGLHPDTELHAGIYLPDDEVGNCRQFSHLLRGEAQRRGARFRFHTDVQRIVGGPAPQLVHRRAPPEEHNTLIVSAESAPNDAQDTQPMTSQPITEGFDAVVVCAALGATALLRPLGVKLPLRAVHGYSITAPLRHHEGRTDHGPRSALTDARYRVAISRLGARVRVAGGAEVGGSDATQYAGSLAALYTVLHDWFPGSAHLSQAQRWKGARPTLPDGPPVLGRSGIDGVWVNLGHGASGWALACGSARLLADAIQGRPAAIDIEGLGVERLRV